MNSGRTLASILVGIVGFGAPNYAAAKNKKYPVAILLEDAAINATPKELYQGQKLTLTATGDVPEGAYFDVNGNRTKDAEETAAPTEVTLDTVGKRTFSLYGPDNKLIVSTSEFDVKAVPERVVEKVIEKVVSGEVPQGNGLPSPSKPIFERLDLQLDLGGVLLNDTESLNLPAPANQSSLYNQSGFNFSLVIPRLVVPVHDYWNVLGRLQLNFGFPNGEHTINENDVGNMDAFVYHMLLAPGVEAKLGTNHAKAFLEAVVDLTYISANGIIQKPGLKQGFPLTESSTQYTIGANAGFEFMLGNSDINGLLRLFAGPHYYSDKHGATGAVGQLGLSAAFNSQWIVAEGSVLYTLSRGTVLNPTATEDVSTLNWDASILFYPTQRFGFGYCGKGSSAEPSIVGADFIERSRDVSAHSLCLRVGLGGDRDYSGRESLVEKVVDEPTTQPQPEPTPEPRQQSTPEQRLPTYIPSTVSYEKAEVYGDQDPFEVYNQLTDKVRGMTRLSLADYNAKRAAFMVKIDELSSMSASELAAGRFVLTLDELATDLSLCDYAQKTLNQARKINKASSDALTTLNAYSDSINKICQRVEKQYRDNGLLQTQSQPVEKGE
ncbi:hypothetical protein HZA96_06135 [Candidatus Woesearchaeota archaeon]|nr:hypothetical protein [Candidatus Woesearchaeota archaeon]